MGWNKYEGPTPPMGSGPSTAVGVVTQVMSTLQSQMSTFTAQTLSTLSQLGDLSIPDVGPMPDIAITPRDINLNWPAPNAIDVGELGALDAAIPADPGARQINTAVSFSPPAWNPSVATLNLPNAPAGIDTSGMPSKPNVDMNVDLPVAPSFQQPVLDALDAVTIPQFTFPTLPTFDEQAPQFTEVAPNVVINWIEPAYSSESLTEVQAVIRRMMAGGTGLKKEIEEQLFERARQREDRVAAKAIATAHDTVANKGYVAPPGLLVAQVNAAIEQNQLAANALQRETQIKAADIEQENMRFAVQQSLAAENLLVNIFNNAAQRSFEMARFTVESQIQVFNSKVSLYNALASAYQTKAQVFKTKIDAALAALDVYRTQIEGQKVIGEINMQRVQAFNAKVQALLSYVEVYKAQMQGAQVKTEVIRAQLDAYRTDVQAYAEKLNAEKTRFDAYRTQIEGEVAKVGILDAEARVYSAQAGVAEAAASVRAKQIQADVEVMQAETQRFAALVDRSKATLQAALSKVEARARVEGLKIQNLTAQSDANRSKNEATIRVGEQALQTNIAITSASIEKFKVAMSKVMQEADLKARSLQAAGQITATLAGGAMAAQHVQASIGSSASDNTSVSFGFNQGAQEVWNYTPTSTG